MLLGKISGLLNRTPAMVAIEQIRKLYMRLYPYMTTDFAHMADVQKSLSEIDAKLETLSAAIGSHIHAASPVGGPPLPSGVTIPVPPTVFTPAYALEHILPPGYPQPTGEGPPAIYPSRAASPVEIVAIPPLSPSDFIG